MPGEQERRQEEVRRREGITLFAEDWEAIVLGLRSAGLPTDELVERFGPGVA